MIRSSPPGTGPEPEPLPEITDWLDEKVVTIPFYEPANEVLSLTARTLTTHTIVLGGTGSGKTTSCILWFIKSLIQHGSDQSTHRPGVFIFDLNGDATVGLVKKWAAEVGRSADVRLLTQDTGHFDLFSNIRTFEDLPSATSQFMHGGWIDDSSNAYWYATSRTLIDAALSICLAVKGRLDTDTVLRFLTNWLVAKQPSPEDEILLSEFELMAAEAPKHLDKHLLSKFEYVRATVQMWNKLDGKTKSILNSILLDALGPLISLETRRYLDSSRGKSFVPEELSQGLIMVFSLPAAKNLESAALLGRLIKARLYVALQNRAQDRNQRLCALIADEYHYLASGGRDRSSDITALATLRSRSVAVVAATQSLDHLAAVMNAQEFRSLLPNFGNHFFFRSTEGSTGAFATSVMGTRTRENSLSEELGHLIVGLPPSNSLEFVCPPGALAQLLEPCQAYVSTSTGYRSPGPIWLGANHECPSPTLGSKKDPTASVDALGRLRDAIFPKPKPKTKAKAKPAAQRPKEPVITAEWPYSQSIYYYDEATWYRLLNERRFRRSLYPSFHSFRKVFSNLGQKPEGLETLPLCWWETIYKITERFCVQHPMQLVSLFEKEGCLEIMLSGNDAPAPLYLEWIARLQSSIYPTRTRRLKRRDQRQVEAWEGEADLFFDDHDESSNY